MDIQDILQKIEKFKEKNKELSFDIIIKEVTDSDDVYGDLYIIAKNDDALDDLDLQGDELLLTIENPTDEDLKELHSIAAALKNFI